MQPEIIVLKICPENPQFRKFCNSKFISDAAYVRLSEFSSLDSSAQEAPKLWSVQASSSISAIPEAGLASEYSSSEPPPAKFSNSTLSGVTPVALSAWSATLGVATKPDTKTACKKQSEKFYLRNEKITSSTAAALRSSDFLRARAPRT